MAQKALTSHFQEVLEMVESLSLDEQAMLVEIIQRRVTQHRRERLIQEVMEAREAYRSGDMHSGTLADLMAELEE